MNNCIESFKESSWNYSRIPRESFGNTSVILRQFFQKFSEILHKYFWKPLEILPNPFGNPHGIFRKFFWVLSEFFKKKKIRNLSGIVTKPSKNPFKTLIREFLENSSKILREFLCSWINCSEIHRGSFEKFFKNPTAIVSGFFRNFPGNLSVSFGNPSVFFTESFGNPEDNNATERTYLYDLFRFATHPFFNENFSIMLVPQKHLLCTIDWCKLLSFCSPMLRRYQLWWKPKFEMVWKKFGCSHAISSLYEN